MSGKKKKQQKKQNFFSVKLRGILAGICLALAVSGAVAYAEESSNSNTTSDNRKLQNGSFEEGQTFTNAYSQPDQSAVPSWNTTAFQGKIELFRKNTNTYISGVTLEPTDGTYAAELNALSNLSFCHCVVILNICTTIKLFSPFARSYPLLV